MTARRAALIFLIGMGMGAPSAAYAGSMAAVTLSNQELSAEVTGVYVTLTARNFAPGSRDLETGIGGGRYAHFFGVETVSIDAGDGSIAQAATSVSVRASLALSAGQGLKFGPR
jgi:hypothetical protein